MAKSIQDYEQDRMAPVTVTILDDDGDQKQYASTLHYSLQNIELEVGTGVCTYGYAYYLHESSYIQESPVEAGPLQLFNMTSVQSGQQGFVNIRQLTAVDWLCSFLSDKPNLHL